MWQLYIISDKGPGYAEVPVGPPVETLEEASAFVRFGEHLFNEWVEVSRGLDSMAIQPFEWLGHWEGGEVKVVHTDGRSLELDENDKWTSY